MASDTRDPGNRLLEKRGDTPFSRLARLPYYRHDLLRDGTFVIPWIRRGFLAMALGEPVGRHHALGSAIQEFVARRRSEGLKTVFAPIRPSHRTVFQGAGFQVFFIGKSARLYLPTFDLRGRKARSLRHALNRGQRVGYRLELVPPGELDWGELKEVSDHWLARKRLPELRFGIGWFDRANLLGSRVGLIRDRSGRVEAFVSLIEDYRSSETALDLMRYRPETGAGTMDFLLTSLALALQEEGKQTLDLGLAPLAGWGEGLGGRALRRILEFGRPLYNFEGLYAFKNKFRPRWEERYLALESGGIVPRILAATAAL